MSKRKSTQLTSIKLEKSNNLCNTFKIMWNDISNFFTRKTFSKKNATRSNFKSRSKPNFKSSSKSSLKTKSKSYHTDSVIEANGREEVEI